MCISYRSDRVVRPDYTLNLYYIFKMKQTRMQEKYISSFIVALIGIIIGISFIGSTKEEIIKELVPVVVVEHKISPYNELIKDYDGFLSQIIDTTNTVGAAVAIVSKDSVLYMKTFGLRNAEGADSVDIHTAFRLASVSKGFAGVLASILNEKKVLNLDEKVMNILPGFQLKDSINSVDLTIKHTLNHSSGLVPHAFDNLLDAGVPLADILPKMKEVEIAATPGMVYGYQNVVFSLIDTILRVKTKHSYRQHLKEQVLKPLKMVDASTLQLSGDVGANVAYPHVYASGKYVPIAINSRYYSVAPAAGVNASISDMAKWLKALLGSNPDVLDTKVLNQITSPSISTPLKRRYTHRWGDVQSRSYSLGWRIFNYYDRDINYHGGYVKGYRAEIAFCAEEGIGIVFLQNSPNSVASRSVPEFWNRYFTFNDTTGM